MAYTITPKNLTIAHGDDPEYWEISCDPCSGSEIAKLVKVCWFDIRGSVPAGCLRNDACYSVYLVFKLDSGSYGLEKATASVGFLEEKAVGTDDEGYAVFIDKPRADGEHGRFPVGRDDGWMELKLGDFINDHGPSSTVEMRIFETKSNNWKAGIMIQGIELRPHVQIYTITPKNLTISHGDNPSYWKICSDPCSTSEVAKLVKVCWFDVRACVAGGCLSNNACYSVYLVFKLDSGSYGLEKATARVRLLEAKAPGTDDEGYTVFIDKQRADGEHGCFPVKRCDGWMELKLGDFVNSLGPSSTVEIRIFETKSNQWKSGMVIKGIELRPHH